MNNLLGPLMGWLADRVRRVWMLRVGSIVASLASVGAGASTGVPQLVGTRFAAGLAAGVSQPAAFPLLTDYYRTDVRGRVFASLFAFGALGGVVGPTIAGRLGETIGWRGALIALGLLATSVSLGTFLIREPRRGAAERAEAGLADTAYAEPPPISFAEGWRAARSIATVRKFWIASPIIAIGGTGMAYILVTYWSEVFLLGPSARGYLGTAAGVAGLLGLIVSGPVTDRMLNDRPGRILTLLGLVSLVQAAAYVVMSFSPYLWLSVAVSLPIGFASALLLPGFITLMSLVVPPRFRGFGIQTINWFNLLGLLAFSQLLGFASSVGIRQGMLAFIPFLVIGALVIMSAGPGVERDMRAARAAAIADAAVSAARKTGSSKVLVCRDIDVTYGGVQDLFNVDYDVAEGETVAVIGTNGAGKSTLLRAIVGLHEASNGAIFVDGRDITHAPSYEIAAHGVVLMPGGAAIFPTLTVRENLLAALWLRQGDDDGTLERVLELFPVLRERWEETAGNLSGGQHQMVGLAQALLMRPRLLIIDELSLGLAPSVVEELLAVIEQIRQQGTSVVLVEQSVNVALTVARRAVFMEKGRIYFDGPTEELLGRHDLMRSVFMGGAATGGGSRAARLSSDTAVALEVENLEVSFGGNHVLRGAGLHVRAGEIVGLIGPNGAGKTTLFDAISGFVQPTSGSIRIDGADATDLTPARRAQLGLGRSFQRAELFPTLTVRENIAIAFERLAHSNPLAAAAWLPKLRKAEGKLFQRVDDLIELLGLGAFATKFVGELSTGSRRAVDIACIMAMKPKVLLLDEPSSGLAQAETEELGPAIRRLVRETGCGVLVIEHDLPLVTSISDRLMAMELGVMISEGSPADVTTDPRVLESYLSADARILARSDIGSVALEAVLATVNEP
jgi:branched-chain amino acid transport system ATP-binding protein